MGMEKTGHGSVVVLRVISMSGGTSLIPNTHLRPRVTYLMQGFAFSRGRPCSCLLAPSLGPALSVELPQEFPSRDRVG